MSSIKMDLSKYKHLKSDDKSTTLQHPAGHIITVAHASLPKEHQTMLKALVEVSKNDETPEQKAESETKMAEGGVTSEPKELKEQKPYKPPTKGPTNIQRPDNKHGAIIDKTKPVQPVGKVIREAGGGLIQQAAQLAPLAMAMMAEGGQPEPEQYDQFGYPVKDKTKASSADALSGYAEGGETGVRTPVHNNPGRSAQSYQTEAGRKAESPEHKEIHANNAKHLAKENLSALKSMPNPNLKGLADGGKVKMASGGMSEDPDKSSRTEFLKKAAEHYSAAADSLGATGFGTNHQNYQDPQQDPNPQPTGKDFAPNQNTPQPSAEPTPSPQPQASTQAQPQVPNSPMPQAPTQASPEIQPDSDVDSSPDAAQDNGSDMSMPQTGTMAPPPQPQAPADTSPQGMYQTKLNELLNENSAQQKDLMLGHINPKTYADLFAKTSDNKDRGTLSKLGLLAGVFLGGLGGGLTHQPNVVLGAMDKIINNDLEKQKQGVAGAQNFFRAYQANNKQLADIDYLQKQGKLTDANAGLARAQLRQYDGLLSSNSMYLKAMHQQYEAIQKLPEGPEKQRRMQGMGQLFQAAQGKMNLNNQEAAKASVNAQMIMNQGPSLNSQSQGQGAAASPVDLDQINYLRYGSQQGVKGYPTSGEMEQIQQSAGKLDGLDAMENTYKNNFKELGNMFGAGDIKGFNNKRKALITDHMATVAPLVGHDVAQQEIDSLYPTSDDWKTGKDSTRAVKLKAGLRHFENAKQSIPFVKQYGILKPQTQPSDSQGNIERRTKDGKTAIYDSNKKFIGYK